MDTQQAFEILNLKQTASLEDAKHSYISKVKFYHPDRFHNDVLRKQKGEEKLKEINLAYELVKIFLSTSNINTSNSHSFYHQTSHQTKKKSESKSADKDKKRHEASNPYQIMDMLADFVRKHISTVLDNIRQIDIQQFFEDATKEKKSSETLKSKQRQPKNFQEILKDAEDSINISRRSNKKYGMKQRKKFSGNKKRVYQKNSGKWQNNSDKRERIEPVQKIRPISKIGRIGSDR